MERGLPHGRFSWAARLNPRVLRVYEILHGCPSSHLVSSCDNAFFSPDLSAVLTLEEGRASHANASHGAGRLTQGGFKNAREKAHRQNKPWPHSDHNCHDTRYMDENGTPLGDWMVFQGLLYVWSSEGNQSSTTVVWPGSHRREYQLLMADDMMRRQGMNGKHFCKVDFIGDPEVREQMLAGWQASCRRVRVPAGSLFLWDSRTLHQGYQGGPRLAQPVCWEPRIRRSEAAYERKLAMAALGLASTHWASLGLPHTLYNKPKCGQSTDLELTEEGQLSLPLKATLQPVTLKKGVQVEALWDLLKNHNWDAPLEPEVREALESSLRQRFRSRVL